MIGIAAGQVGKVFQASDGLLQAGGAAAAAVRQATGGLLEVEHTGGQGIDRFGEIGDERFNRASDAPQGGQVDPDGGQDGRDSDS